MSSIAATLHARAEAARAQQEIKEGVKRMETFARVRDAFLNKMTEVADGGKFVFEWRKESFLEYLLGGSLKNHEWVLDDLRTFAMGSPQEFKWEEVHKHCDFCDCQGINAAPCSVFVVISF